MASPSTKPLVAVSNLREDVAILQNGSLRMIVEISAINFELRSEQEQAAILQGFQNFLNSVDFPVQIVIDSRKFEIEDYLKTIDAAGQTITNELLKVQMGEYSNFIREISTLANIMSKKFYIVVPFYIIESSGGAGIFDQFRSLFRSNRSAASIDPEKFAAYRSQLAQRVELVFDGLAGLGLKARVLGGSELEKVMYGFYNPGVKTIT